MNLINKNEMNLIINADDFGLSPSVNKAIIELATLGTISSTTVMVNMPFANRIVDLLYIDRFGIGLHFNISQGKPISNLNAVDSLVQSDGTFYPNNTLVNRIRRNLVKPEQIRSELKAQFELLREWIGDRIDHIDSHQDINKQFIVSNILCDFSKTLSKRIGLRVYNKVYLTTNERLSNPGMTNIGTYGVSRSLKEICFRHRNKILRNYFHLTNGMLITQKHSIRHLLNLLLKMNSIPNREGVYEVMCHPATSTTGLSETSLMESRVEEFEILKSSDFQNFVAKNKLRTFSDLI